MLPWSERPTEVANLLNPAFLAVLVRDATKDYERAADEAMDYSLPFIILPVVLHRPTREKLPLSTAKKLHVWLEEHPEVHVGFPGRAQRLSSFVREAIRFGSQREIFQINGAGNLESTNRQLRTFQGPVEAEHQQCRKQTSFLGRWFAKTRDPETLYTMWGIRP